MGVLTLHQNDDVRRPRVLMMGTLLGAILLGGTMVLAATEAPSPRSGAAQGSGGGTALSEDLREAMNMAMMVRLKQELGLDREKAFDLWDLIEAHRSEKQGFRRSIGDQLKILREQTVAAQPDEAAIVAALDRLTTLRGQMAQHDGKLLEQTKAILTPVQQAKFVLFYVSVLQRMGHRLRGGHPGGGSLPPGAGPEGGPGRPVGPPPGDEFFDGP